MYKAQISGTGLYTPKEKISNEELVQSYNKYVDEFNKINSHDIETGKIQPLEKSSAEFIEKASGVKSRYVQNKSGILDTSFMRPNLRERSEEELSNLAEMGVIAAQDAIKNANIENFVAIDLDDYVEKAFYYSKNINELEKVRKQLFDGILNTPLFDPKRFSKNFCDALDDMHKQAIDNYR